ncbi:DUF2461 domain-containing protein [Kitasatospora albolonga]|uniref:DUF2461 domain-containing protein n=1 Tax=Kitasatospora albolonga TaxID=68173 RepID=UPI0031E9D303
MTFQGWPAEAFEFFEQLETDNSKPFWQAHKARYERDVRAPMLALLDALEPEFGPGKVFRPFRDVRFSKDKTPYKTHIGAWLDSGGYIQLSADHLACGNGMYRLATDQLARYRAAVAEDVTGAELERVIAAVEAGGLAVHGQEPLRTTPRGFTKDHPRIGLLRNKGLVAWQEWEPAAWMGTPEAAETIAGFIRDSQPLMAWLDDHVGPSELPAR